MERKLKLKLKLKQQYAYLRYNGSNHLLLFILLIHPLLRPSIQIYHPPLLDPLWLICRAISTMYLEPRYFIAWNMLIVIRGSTRCRTYTSFILEICHLPQLTMIPFHHASLITLDWNLWLILWVAGQKYFARRSLAKSRRSSINRRHFQSGASGGIPVVIINDNVWRLIKSSKTHENLISWYCDKMTEEREAESAYLEDQRRSEIQHMCLEDNAVTSK